MDNSRYSKKEIVVSIPNRIHMFVFDFGVLKDIKKRAGGLGLSVETDNHMIIRISNETLIKSQHDLVLAYFCDELKKILLYEGGFEVIVKENIDVHAGYGSTISLIASLCYGINQMFGQPFTIDYLWRFILERYCEEEGGRLINAFDTGVGALCSFYGGMNYMEMDYSFLHINIPKNYCLLAFIPQYKSNQENLTVQNEYERFEYTKEQEENDKKEKQDFISNNLIPHMFERDFYGIGKDLKVIHQLGSKKVECSYYDYDFQLAFIDYVLDHGGCIAGLSSAGPINYIFIDEKNVESMIGNLRKYGVKEHIKKMRISESGIKEYYNA